ncbi:MAG: extracellular solute-binding protein, partial [Pontimonas sp.]
MRHFVRRRSMVGIATLSVAALALAGCAADDSGETSTSSGSSDSGSTTSADCEAFADYLGNEGETVEIYTTIVEPESTLFQESFLDFEECTGITIEWNGDQAFEEQIAVRVAGGTAPDLAIFPQPGLLKAFGADLVAASDAVAASVDANYTADWKNYGTVDGTFYAAPLGANVKSFVWYSPKTFADNGWDIPTTWGELIALSDEIAASDFDGYAWCAGIESGAATGWAATDWMEDLMLRFQDAATY